MLDEALARHRAGDHEAAERLYRQALEENDAQADAQHLLGVLLAETGRPDEALEHVERAIGLDDQRGAYYLTLSGILFRRGDRPGALANAEQAAELDPNDAEAHNSLGYLRMLAGDLDGAEAALRLALKARPDAAPVLINLGQVALARGAADRARSLFQQVLEREPGNIAARVSLGQAFLAEGAAAFAEECFRRGLAEHPGNVPMRTLLARAVLEDGRGEEARELYAALLEDEPEHFEALVGLGDVALADGRPGQAANQYVRALARRRGHPETMEKLGDALLADGQYAAATRCFQRLRERGRQTEGLLARLARSHAGSGQTDEALALWHEALAANPGDVEAALGLARHHGGLEEHDEAAALLERLPGPARERGRVRVALARERLMAGRPREALVEAEAVGETSAERLAALELAGRALDALGETAAAAERFSLLAAEAARPPPALRPVPEAPEDLGGWPQEPPADGRGEPLFLTGLPGSGVAAVAAALGQVETVDLLADRRGDDPRRRDFLETEERPDPAALEEDAVLLARRRYWHALRRARTKLTAGVAGVDWLPVERLDVPLIARVFPRATVLLVTRDPADHLLHAESLGWREGSAPGPIDLEEFYAGLERLIPGTGLRLLAVDFDQLRSGDDAPLEALFRELGVRFEGFGEALEQSLYDATGLPRYWAAGQGARYAGPLGMDEDQIEDLAARIRRLGAPSPEPQPDP